MKSFRRMLVLTLIFVFILTFFSGCADTGEEETSSLPEATGNKTLTYTTEAELIDWLQTEGLTGTYYFPTLNDSVKLKGINIIGYVSYVLTVTRADGSEVECSLNWMLEDDGVGYLSQTISMLGLVPWNGSDNIYCAADSSVYNSIYWIFDEAMFQLITPAGMSTDEITALFAIETKSF